MSGNEVGTATHGVKNVRGVEGAEDRGTRHSGNADGAATIPPRSERGPEGAGTPTDAWARTSAPLRFTDDPTHGITTDPVTGRRYVLAYVELGTRVVEALHHENLEPAVIRERGVRHRARAARRKKSVYRGSSWEAAVRYRDYGREDE